MRLIDADAFVEAIKKDLRKHPEDDLIYPVIEWFLDNIKGRPTIEQPAWIKASEQLPQANFEEYYRKNGEYPSFCVKIDIGITSTCLEFDGQNWRDYDGNFYNVTHWRELPEPPKEEE